MTSPDSLVVWLNAFLSLFAILNPLGNLGVFYEATRELSPRERMKVFNVTALAGFLTLFILTFTGKWIMEKVFRIGIDEFKIAGGILLTVIGVERILGLKKNSHEHDLKSIYEMAVVPLAVPLLVGPGAIATSLLTYDREGPLVAGVTLVLVSASVWIILQASPILMKILGRFGTLVISRIVYIFITAIGVRFLLSGLTAYFGLTRAVTG